MRPGALRHASMNGALVAIVASLDPADSLWPAALPLALLATRSGRLAVRALPRGRQRR